MSDRTCPSCNTKFIATKFNGRCATCGAGYRATLTSRMLIYGAVFVGMLFGPMAVTPFIAQAGVNPQSAIGIIIGIVGSITAVLFLGALSLRLLTYDWSPKT